MQSYDPDHYSFRRNSGLSSWHFADRHLPIVATVAIAVGCALLAAFAIYLCVA